MKKYGLIGMFAVMLVLIVALLIDLATINSETHGTLDPEQLVQVYITGIKQNDRTMLTQLCFQNDLTTCGIEQKLAQYGGYDLSTATIEQQTTDRTSLRYVVLNGQTTNAAGNTIPISDVLTLTRQGDRWFLSADAPPS